MLSTDLPLVTALPSGGWKFVRTQDSVTPVADEASTKGVFKPAISVYISDACALAV